MTTQWANTAMEMAICHVYPWYLLNMEIFQSYVSLTVLDLFLTAYNGKGG